MSIDNVLDRTPRVQYVAATSQTAFDYPFAIFQNADLVVDVDGVTKTLTTDYNVSGAGDDTGGTVTFVTAPGNGAVVTIYRDIAIERTSDFQQSGPWASTTTNDELDRITLVQQQLESRIGRALRLPITSAALDSEVEFSPIANWLSKYITINADGVPEPAALVAGTISQSIISDLLNPQTDAEAAAGVTPVQTKYPELHAFRYMTTAQVVDVVTRALTLDVRAALQNAIRVAQEIGGEVYLPRGSYLIRRVAGNDSTFNGIHVPFTNVFGYTDHIRIRGDGRSTVLCAGDNSMTVIRWSESLGILQDIAIDGNSKTGVTGLSLISSNTSNTALAEHIDWNTFRRVDIRSCAEGIEMENPSAGGCYYNHFDHCVLYDNTRHIRMRDNAQSGGTNRNIFTAVSMNGGNTGVWIDGADTNRFIACSFEDIINGVSPSASPTAVYTTATGSLFGLNSADNQFIGCVAENCTTHLNANQRRISILGGTLGTVGLVTGTTLDLHVGGDRQYLMRNLQLGSTNVAGLLIQPGEIPAYSSSQAELAVSSNQAGSYPFDADGHLIVRGAPVSGKDIVIVSGASSTPRVKLTDTGDLTILSASINEKTVTLTYGATVNIDLRGGNNFVLTVTNTSAFTIAQPTNDVLGKNWTLTIINASGGAMGAITWSAAFKMSAWTNPANGQNRSLRFQVVSASFERQIGQTGVDVPN